MTDTPSTNSASPNSASQNAAPLDTIHLLGLRVDRVSMDSALSQINRWIEIGGPHQIVTADASMVVTARDNPEFAALVERVDLVTPDGAGLLWASRRLKVPIVHKVSGVDLSERLVALSKERGWRIFFFGAAPGIADAAKARMEQKYPGAQIVGARDGFFGAGDEAEVVARIAAAKPDIVLAALGIPKQEFFLDRHRDKLGASVVIGVGGTLDVFSGTVKRAPVWMQRAGLEWLYRIAGNPKKRLSKAKALPRFVKMTLLGR